MKDTYLFMFLLARWLYADAAVETSELDFNRRQINSIKSRQMHLTHS